MMLWDKGSLCYRIFVLCANQEILGTFSWSDYVTWDVTFLIGHNVIFHVLHHVNPLMSLQLKVPDYTDYSTKVDSFFYLNLLLCICAIPAY